MREDLRDAIDSACTSDLHGTFAAGVPHRRGISFERLKGLLLNVVRELPEEMTVNELRRELED